MMLLSEAPETKQHLDLRRDRYLITCYLLCHTVIPPAALWLDHHYNWLADNQMPVDWLLLHEVLKLFNIFVRPSKRLQASTYPTLNYTIPMYLRMLQKLEDSQTAWGSSSILGQACTAAHKTKWILYFNSGSKPCSSSHNL
jgi:hypothetical protein